jgi:putative peptidoglycan lipid II flippase
MSLNRRILKDTLIVTAIGAIAQGIGFFVPVLVAQRFGTTRLADAYYLAFAVPDLLTGIIIGGAIKIVFVPVLVEERLKHPDEVQRIIGAAISTLLLLSGLGMLIIIALAGLGLLDLGHDRETAILTQRLTLEMLPLIPLTLFFYLFNAVYNSHQRFALAEVAQAVKFALVIACLWLLVSRWGIHSLVIGQVVGQTGALLVVAAGVKQQLGVSLRPNWSMPEGFRRMLKLSVLPFASVLLTQINPFTARLISAYLPEGSVSVLSYAQRLASIPSLLIGAGVGAVLISYWSKLAAEEDREALGASLNRGLSVLMMTLLPLATGLVLLRDPLVNLVFQRGAFDVESAAATASVFAILAIQIMPTYLHMIIVRVLLAEKAVQTLFWLSLLSMVTNFASMAILVWMGLGVWGVAAGMLLGTSAVMLTTAVIVHRRYARLALGYLAKTTLQAVLAVAVMTVVVTWLQGLGPADLVSHLVRIAVCGLAGAVVYLSALRLLGHPDAISMWNLAASRAGIGQINPPDSRDVS